MDERKDCDQCGHPFDPHALISTDPPGRAPRGGVILCPMMGCQCYATWSVPQLGTERGDVRVPGTQELHEMRWMIQHHGESPPLTMDTPVGAWGLTPTEAFERLFRTRRLES